MATARAERRRICPGWMSRSFALLRMTGQTRPLRARTRGWRGGADPPGEPLEIPPHLLALQHWFVEHVPAPRVDVELHGLAQSLERAVVLPRAGDRHASIALSVL